MDPSQPEHPIKNRPDKTQKPDMARGQRYVESLGLANARDIVKMLRWNDKYGIKFMRLSSEMFPFASHEEYGYKLAPFASEALAEAGRVATELGHRLTTHPGQVSWNHRWNRAVLLHLTDLNPTSSRNSAHPEGRLSMPRYATLSITTSCCLSSNYRLSKTVTPSWSCTWAECSWTPAANLRP